MYKSSSSQSIARQRVLLVLMISFSLVVIVLTAVAVQAMGSNKPAGAGAASLECRQFIANGGFEAADAWTVYSSGGMALLSSFPPPSGAYHSGQRGAYLGDYNNAVDYIAQKISIPADATKADLHVWWQIETEEDAQQAYDLLSATLEDSSGHVLATLHQWSNKDTAQVWQESQFNLLSYKGKSVTLRFTAHTDANLPTAFYLDDVNLNVCVPASTLTRRNWLPRVNMP